MFILYYFPAKDEERRMLGQFGEGYREYMNRTGMFVPRSVEALLSAPFGFLSGSSLKPIVVTLCIPIVLIGTGFLLRAVTLSSLPMEANRNVTLVSIPADD